MASESPSAGQPPAEASRRVRPPDLPDFEAPPVEEVGLSVAFEPLADFGVVHFGLLWDAAFRQEFPRVEEQPHLEIPVETFGPLVPPRINFRAMTMPPTPRMWFENETGTELIQLQSNWFARNWRKMDRTTDYPHYEALVEPFQRDLQRFLDFVTDQRLGEFVPTQCEVTYVNHIDRAGVWDHHGQLSKVLSVISEPTHDLFLPEPEVAQMAVQYVIRDEDQPLGRLYVNAQPGFRQGDNEPLFILTLTARGQPIGEGVEGVLRFLDTGRRWIDKGFASLTREGMQKAWRRIDGHVAEAR